MDLSDLIEFTLLSYPLLFDNDFIDRSFAQDRYGDYVSLRFSNALPSFECHSLQLLGLGKHNKFEGEYL